MADSVRTDLAMEAQEAKGEISGVSVEEARLGGMTITRVRVLDEEGARALGKSAGAYVTVECPELPRKEPGMTSALHDVIARELSAMLPKKRDLTALVVGLGNWNLTPDALGPKTAGRVLVTRHILQQMPQAMDDRLRSVCAISPGVLGITGVETGEIVRGVVERVRPDVVLCIDSLAARRTSRILTTVQMTDTGVQPGSGVGNGRGEITQATLGVPVVAIGVPMVVHASTISHDAVEAMMAALKEASGEGGEVYELLHSFGEEGMEQVLRQTLPRELGGLIVTPSGIDEAVDAAACAVAMGINLALHPELDPEEITLLLA